jgi:hypothetical protein
MDVFGLVADFMARKIIHQEANLSVLPLEMYIQLLYPSVNFQLSLCMAREERYQLFKIGCCHPGSLVVAIIKASLIGTLLPKALRPLQLANKENGQFLRAICITSKADCDMKLIDFFA